MRIIYLIGICIYDNIALENKGECEVKRVKRLSIITKILVQNPGKRFKLNYFTDKLNASKPSISEDIDIIRASFKEIGEGDIVSVIGAGGGVIYLPKLSPEYALKKLEDLNVILNKKERILLDEFLFYADILYSPDFLNDIAGSLYLATEKYDIDGILTIETKGVPLAVTLSRLFNVPMIVARKSNTFSDGNTISVHYKSQSRNVLSSMYVSKGLIEKGMNLLVVDDFSKAGGTIEGLKDLARSCEANVVASCVFMKMGPEDRLSNILSLYNFVVRDNKSQIEINQQFKDFLKKQ